MANDPLALADMIADALNLSGADVTDLVQSVPFLNLLPLEISSNGETHLYAKETGAPVVGFRAPNVGREEDSSIDTLVTVTLKLLDFSWWVDKGIADIWRRGREDLIAREGLRHIKSAMVAFETQVIYGVTSPGDSAGFVGMAAATTVDALADAMTIDAGGTTASTASSCWAVRIGPNDLTAVAHGDGIQLGETVTQRMVSTGTLTVPFYRSHSDGE